MKQTYHVNESELQLLAERLAKQSKPGSIIYLKGQLGAGKTTFARAFIRACGFTGKIKSPTFTLVEGYEIDGKSIYHFDLYRLKGEEELEYIGLQDYFTAESICLIEWPEKAQSTLPSSTVCCTITIAEQEDYREVMVEVDE